MQEESAVFFGPFRLDFVDERVWHGREALNLTRKAFAVLRYLVEHGRQLVTKEALFTAIWPEVVVSEAALTVCIHEIRQALGESPKTPRYIETVSKRGYRWIAPLATTPPVTSCQFSVLSQQNSATPPLATDNWPLTPPLVGREAELAQLHTWLGKAVGGKRQLVFVTGEPGIGKTTLIEAFLLGVGGQGLGIGEQETRGWGPGASPSSPHPEFPAPNPQSPPPSPWLGRGQCIEHHGAGEAYMPILEALSRLCRAPGGDRLLTLLNQHAPTWLVQMPALLSTEDLETLQRKVQGATRERMLREMAEAIEALTAERQLVLVLEDLHWSDPSTLDLLALLARRREPARLLVIGTYRPSELLASNHPLCTVIQELLSHKQCQEMALEGLSEVAVEEYLEHRFLVRVFPTRLAKVLHQRTEGNPLFLVNLVDDLVMHGVLTDGEEGWMVQGDLEVLVQQVPESSRQLIAAQMALANPSIHQTLAAASVAGAVFSAAAVAAALETPVTEVETRCEEVTQRRLFVQRMGIEAWPDGTTAARYGFRHALYQELWHEQGTISQRQLWHRRIGLRKELAYNGRASEIAAELALHFEQGQDYGRAVHYLQRAAQNASTRSANTEAIQHLTRGLELLKTLPDTPERAQQELALQITLGAPLIATKGYAAPEAEQVYARAQELCRQLGDMSQLVPALWGLWAFYLVRADHQVAWRLAEELLTVAQKQPDRLFLPEGHLAPGLSSFYRGEFTSSHEYLAKGLTYFDPQRPRSRAFLQVPGLEGVSSLSYLAWTLWALGYADHALTHAQDALSLAKETSRPFSIVYALEHSLVLYQLRREGPLTQDAAEATITLCTEHGFSFYLSQATILRGWALAQQGRSTEGIAQIREGLAARRATGAQNLEPYFLALLAEVYEKVAKPENGLHTLGQAFVLVGKTGEREYEAELYRLKGELVLESGVRGPESEEEKQKSKGKRQKAKISSTQPLTPSTQEAEACFLKAIDIARHQQAKSLELRAVMSLSRLWQQQGKQKQAHQMLAEIYSWFTEGFDTKDLQEAKVLLEELRG